MLAEAKGRTSGPSEGGAAGREGQDSGYRLPEGDTFCTLPRIGPEGWVGQAFTSRES